MHVSRAYLSGLKDGRHLETDDPEEVYDTIPGTVSVLTSVATTVLSQLTTGQGYPTKPMLYYALGVMSAELDSAFLMLVFHQKEWEVTITLELTGQKARAEVEAGNGIMYARDELDIHPDHLVTIDYNGGEPVESQVVRGGGSRRARR